MSVWGAIKFWWKNRKIISSIKREITDVKNAIKKAKKDNKITKAELKTILQETDDVLDLIIEML